MLLLYLLLYQAKELRNAVPEGHVAGLGGHVDYRGNTVIVVVMAMAGYPRYIRRRRSCRLGFLAGSGSLAGSGTLAGNRAFAWSGALAGSRALAGSGRSCRGRGLFFGK